jgi:hypothetical protein
MMRGTLIAIGFLATANLALPASARGSLHLLDSAWNPQHISGLPAEVRNALARMCRSCACQCRDLPKSMMTSWTQPSWLTMMPRIRPMSSPALLRTLLQRIVENTYVAGSLPRDGLGR